ncbi:response regulator transcription factor [Maledivibacter halophilus]|uniref:Stage 0 sporulation protein A homolog n=1 Tax=Maledivibacter halophilus TaxID=36842 RepID=A0A1T5IL42_9FIRM|nr:helix-turn-helix domain-containing protein [Maledivibacter halophilus]SKC39782.1 two component transcriptional regulator, AraC family [Maledivibacter halophilus]
MRRAIIVDDEESSGEIIKYLIKQSNLLIEIVGQAASGDEGVRLIKELKPDIVYLDIKMPVYNGIEVMERINSSYTRSINFIVITAYSYFEYAQSSLRLGAKDILLKPIDPEQFKRAMERVMGYRYTDNQFLNDILEYINQNYSSEIELNKCAKEFHTSSNHISRMFKRHLGKNFIAYLNELRIKKAEKLLKDTELSIKEIAHKIGYNNLNYFYKNFKKLTGTTPKKFKENSG